MTDTVSLLFELQKKIEYLKVQIDNIRKKSFNIIDDGSAQTISQIDEKISSFPTSTEFESAKQELLTQIVSYSCSSEINEINNLITQLKEKLDSDHESFASSFTQLDEIKNTCLAITEDIDEIGSNYATIFNELSKANVMTEEILLRMGNVNSIKESFDAIGNTLSAIQLQTDRIDELMTETRSVFSNAQMANVNTNTILENQQTILSLLQGEEGGESESGSSTNCSECLALSNTINNKIDLILKSMNIEYDDGNNEGEDGSLDDYVEPDLTTQLTTTDKYYTPTFYSATQTVSCEKAYFRCNKDEMLVICFDTELYAGAEGNVRLDLYLNDECIKSFDYSYTALLQTSQSFVTQSTQQINSIHLTLTSENGSSVAFRGVSYTLFAKNVEFITTNDDYKIYYDYNQYTINKNTKGYWAYAIYDPSTEFNQDSLSFTEMSVTAGRSYNSFSGVIRNSYNSRSLGTRAWFEINKQGKETRQKSTSNKTLINWQKVLTCDITNSVISSNAYILASVVDGVVSLKSCDTATATEATLSGSPDALPFETDEVPVSATIVRMTTSPTINANYPSVIMTSRSGNNFLNHNCRVTTTNTTVALGYGTKVKACYLNDALNIGVFMKVYGTFVLKKLIPYRAEGYNTGLNIPYVDHYALAPSVYTIGEYDEIHPGYNGEYFAIKDGKIQKLKLSDEILKEDAGTFTK